MDSTTATSPHTIAEQLIKEVEVFPELYDRSNPLHTNAERKVEIWESIGNKLATTGVEASKRWKDIRDAFVKSRRRNIARPPNKTGKPYRYAASLEFLLPCLLKQHKKKVTSPLENGEEDAAATGETPLHKSLKRLRTKVALKEAVPEKEEDTAKCEHVPEPDEDDLFFQSMACACKKLPQNVKSFVRFKIHEIIFQAENQLITVPDMTHQTLSTTVQEISM
ncbi:transcription factor Adf-1-like [Anneissia japonica]|uniref:transcription factor Adf-1-like n=1 Tax=Anneissia japonica TaxID=1529436 RepID=UPI001425BA45|nr:transcription factor Adf-1-like [Anneissia japonica]